MILALFAAALAAPLQARLSAEVTPDLRIRGTLEFSEDVALADPLALLPFPEDDLVGFRTWPGRPDAGELRWEGEGVLHFEARLPKRYGALGAIPGDGLWANGGWYPQPLSEEGLPPVEWEVSLSLPPDTAGALNGVVGEGTLTWSGEAERLSLAVLEGGRVSELAPGLVILERGPREKGRDAELVALHERATPGRPLVVVETPDWRRLVRPGQGTLYLSDAAFRLSPPMRRFHQEAVGRGMLSVALPMEDPWIRAIAAAPLAAELQRGREADEWLRFAAWIPWVDALLHNGRASFHAELFGEVFPGDPLADDLAEMFAPRTPGTVVAAKLDDRYGPGTALALARALSGGAALPRACEAVGIEITDIQDWAGPYPLQDLVLDVRREDAAWVVEVARDAPEDAPPEPIPLRVGSERFLWEAPAGPGAQAWTLGERPRRVVLDPEGHVQQSSALNDAWPARWSLVGTAYPSAINLSTRSFVGVAAARLRRVYDTHNAYDGVLWSDEQTLVGGQLRYVRYAGALQDRRTRPHRFAVWGSPALLSERFRPTEDGRLALEAGLNWSWDSRVYYQWPVEGARLSAGVDAGFIPGSEARWGSASASAVQLLSPHPRLVLATRASAGLALGEVDHRLLALGGASAMRGLPANLAVGRQRGLLTLQVRTLPLRDLSLPLAWLYWLDEVCVHGGLELGGVRQATVLEDGALDPEALRETYGAAGWMAGVLVTADGFGAIPGQLGVTVARAEWGTAGLPEAPVQVLLRFGQEF
ncbi:MAG: hypothetical protein H6741_12135 [Alphaproteobacteria bacterium]|nr:hypothetical protein [Alphaproteobacteria bacterium]